MEELKRYQILALMICRELNANDDLLKSERRAFKILILTEPKKLKLAIEWYMATGEITAFRDKIRGELGLPRRNSTHKTLNCTQRTTRNSTQKTRNMCLSIEDSEAFLSLMFDSCDKLDVARAITSTKGSSILSAWTSPRKTTFFLMNCVPFK